MRADWSFFLLTFGCKVNQYETQAVREAWLRYGGRETDDPAGADVALLNTCAVTANAVTDARQAVRRLHRLAPALPLVVAGCACSAAREDLLALPGVVAALAPERKADLLDPARFFACIGLREDAASVCLPEEGRVAATETAPAAARGATGEAAGAFPPFSITGFRPGRFSRFRTVVPARAPTASCLWRGGRTAPDPRRTVWPRQGVCSGPDTGRSCFRASIWGSTGIRKEEPAISGSFCACLIAL